MTDERKISLCIPTYNRYELLIESFISVLGDDRVDEIIISDDASNLEIYDKVHDFVSGISKIKMYRNGENQDCYKNKRTSLTYAKNAWSILLDSDNAFGKEYIDKIFEIENWDNHVAYLPSFAMPLFDYRKYEGKTISKDNVSPYAHDPTFTTMLNTSNYFINREAYISAWDSTINPNTADSIFMNYRLLKNGGRLFVVPGLYYNHRVDDHRGEESGHYNTNVNRTPPGFHDGIINELKNMV